MSDARDNDEAEPIASASPVGQLRRAITGLNQRALRFTRPGSCWLLASVKLGFVIKAAAVLVALAEAFVRGTLDQNTPDRISSILLFAIAGVVIAPVLETLVIMLVHVLTRRWLGLAGFVAANTLLAYALHGPPYTGYSAGAAAAFLIMSYQYESFRERLGTSRAFAGVGVCHAVSNGIAVLFRAIFPN